MRILRLLDTNITDLDKVIYYYKGNEVFKEGHPTNGFKKELIHNEYNHIKERYEEYTNNIITLERIATSKFSKIEQCSSVNKNNIYCELYNLYDSKEELKKYIRAKSNSRCPYCGIIQTHYDVDHILPRSKYPEFSMFTHNLVGVCSICNSRYKGDIFIEDEERQFFNPYGDNFIEETQFLKCTLSVNSIYLHIKFSIENEEDNSYGYSIIKNHFDNLHLNERYKKLLIQDELKRFRNENINDRTREYEDVSLEELKRDIGKKINGFSDFNDNHWEKVFWIALKDCDEYLNLIVNKQIPIN